ncbi:MAG: hypothetical protein JEY71_18280 [Sphaerochaeta sp.]|nr:hypothetical protein [Sphaerochaeta sp.]
MIGVSLKSTKGDIYKHIAGGLIIRFVGGGLFALLATRLFGMKGINTPGQALERGGVASFSAPRGSRISPCFPSTRSVMETW